MLFRIVRFISLAVLGACLVGCAAYPAVQIAGGAMTGYDAMMLAHEYAPREHVEGGQLTRDADDMMERRLRERLFMHDLHTVSAHVVEGNAYLVGEFPSPDPAKQAVELTKTVDGVRSIYCKFYRETTPVQAAADKELRKAVVAELDKCGQLKGAEVRVELVRSEAILIGTARDEVQRTAAAALTSEVNGVGKVVNYLALLPEPEPAPAPQNIEDPDAGHDVAWN